jgi:hypothetical protein
LPRYSLAIGSKNWLFALVVENKNKLPFKGAKGSGKFLKPLKRYF